MAYVNIINSFAMKIPDTWKNILWGGVGRWDFTKSDGARDERRLRTNSGTVGRRLLVCATIPSLTVDCAM
jgi:hypothetical protein